jgi:probable F420-dependent oxidoreductase
MIWPDSVTGKLGEQLDVIRAFWHNWARGEKLDYSGDFYQINLTSPFFTPAAHDYPEIPIFIAGVNTGLAHLAGKTADGFHTHPFHTRAYLQDVLLPRIDKGAQQTGRSPEDVEIVAHAFVVTNPEEREFVRQQIAFYASTPSYRAVMDHHGWAEPAASLSSLVREARWRDLPDLVTDEMVDTIATVAPAAELGDTLKERYDGIAGRINLYLPFIPGERTAFWQSLCTAFQE